MKTLLKTGSVKTKISSQYWGDRVNITILKCSQNSLTVLSFIFTWSSGPSKCKTWNSEIS